MFYRFIIVLLLLLSQHIMAQGKILFLKGEAKLNGKELSRSTIVKQGDTIKTAPSSLILIKFATGSTLKVNQSSELKVSILKPKANATLITLIKGSTFFKKNPKVKGKLNVKTKYATMAVRGTQFFVSYGNKSKDDIFMCVNNGTVLVTSSTNKGKLVHSGEGVSISNEKKISKPIFLPWTKDLNWSLDPQNKNLENSAKIEEKYGDPLSQDYD